MTEEPQETAADLDAELGFDPVVSDTGADDTASGTSVRRIRRRRGTLRRKVGAFGVLLCALTAIGGGYALFASSSGAAETDTAAAVSHGRQLYDVTCITCHGANLQGVHNRGPALIGVGGAATYFQVSTGRMPLNQQGAYAARKTPKFDEQETRDLAAFVQSIGGGPAIPTGKLSGDDAALGIGGELFRLNCASCHGTTLKGAPLSAGKQAPSLNAATALQIYTAMLSGPESMPVFGDNQITPSQKQAIIAYIETLKASNDPGGAGIDRIGPVSEAIVLWVAGVGLLMVAILWIGARSQ